jgi:hypothetical protein
VADSKISALTSYSPPLQSDVLPIVDVSNTITKKITYANLMPTITKFLAPNGGLFPESHTSDTVTANRVYAAKCFLPGVMTVNSIGIQITTGGSAGAKANLGVYTPDGNTKLIDSGAIDVASSGFKSASVAGYVLLPGVYWIVYSFTDTGVHANGPINLGYLGGGDTSMFGYATNTTSANVLPSTLGTINSTGNNGSNILLSN